MTRRRRFFWATSWGRTISIAAYMCSSNASVGGNLSRCTAETCGRHAYEYSVHEWDEVSEFEQRTREPRFIRTAWLARFPPQLSDEHLSLRCPGQRAAGEAGVEPTV